MQAAPFLKLRKHQARWAAGPWVYAYSLPYVMAF